uniref:ATP synthase F0 subunit 8 n=1 Tax=Ibidoecus plataleae TaxID=3004258 RepID=A0A9E9F1Z5_9NEOP|nr:ATP synthase F0 subunit 8 [Ibidoecus plataleae]
MMPMSWLSLYFLVMIILITVFFTMMNFSCPMQVCPKGAEKPIKFPAKLLQKPMLSRE